ncbi:MAG: hypothetical protein H7A26_01835 [Spirochaetales bacterium]|nr:hypothetical protein [Spirochaetales bacterium]
MKKIISSPLMLIFSILILTGVFYSGCNSDTASDGGGITAGDVIGTWIKVWEGDPYQLPSGTDADTLIFDIGESELEAVFYQNTEQVGGFRGTYEISDDEIVVSVTHTWNEGYDWNEGGLPVWEIPDEPQEYKIPASPGSSTLAITDFNEEVIEMDKITFSRPEIFTNPEENSNGWEEEYDGHRLFFDNEEVGSYSYDMNPGGDIDRIGTWDASGTEEGYIRTVIEVYYDGESEPYAGLEFGFLAPYTFDGESGNYVLNYLDTTFTPYILELW